MPWFVIYTKARNEKIVAERLRSNGIEVYCPLVKTRRKWSDRTKMVEEPLFRSYCFVNIEENERSAVFQVHGASSIVRYLFWLGKPAVVRDTEIEAIKLMLNEVDHHAIKVENFQTGDRLRISSGSFTDSAGKVVRQQGKIVSILLDSLQLVITVDLTKNIVQK